MRLSIGTKILAGTAALLISVIAFLNISTVLLFKEDKRAYVYQSQSTAVSLVGREIANSLRRGVDTARVALGSVDPYQPPQAALPGGAVGALQAMVRNQSDVSYVRVLLLERSSGKATQVAVAARDGINVPTEAELSSEWWKALLPEAMKGGYAFVSLSRPGSEPAVGVLALDLKQQDNPAGMPVALGALSLQSLGRELQGLGLTIATHSGWVLYDTVPERMYAKLNISDDPLFDRAVKSKSVLGASEYDLNGERWLGSYANPGLDLSVLTRTEWKKAVRPIYTLTEKCILLGGMAIGLATILALVFSKSLTAPIQRLYRATSEVAQGKFDLALEPGGRDEIGALTESFNVMSRQIGELVVERMRKVQIENELAIASTVQRTLIPAPSFADDRIEIHSHYRSASQCGGDWWGFFRVGSRACLIIADATGHGFPSALITASARSCFSVLQKLAQEHGALSFSPLTMLRYANRAVFDASGSNIMMTMFVALIDFNAGTMTYANAGHNPPWLFRRAGGSFQMSSLIASGYRLGEKHENTEFEERTVPIAPHDILFLYTDGLFEGTDPSGEMFGKKRVKKVVEAGLASGPKAVVDGVIEAFLAHNGVKDLDDDVTVAAAMLHRGKA